MVVWLAATASFYFTTTHRTVVLPVYLTAYASMLFAALGGGLGLLVGLSALVVRPVRRLDPRRLHRSLAIAMVPAWILCQYVSWVVYRGCSDLRLYAANGAILLGSLLLVVLLYRLWAGTGTRKPGSKAIRWVGWSAYAGAIVLSLASVWTRDRADNLPFVLTGPAGATPLGATPSPEDNGLSAGSTRQPVQRIILITADTLRADRLGCYGHTWPTTPSLDAWAAKATVFRNAYSHSSGTVPSFCSIFSGTDPVYVGGLSQLGRLVEGVTTFPEQLQRAGYRTGAVVCQSFLVPERGFGQGFDHYVSISPKHKDPHNVTEAAFEMLDRLGDQDKLFLWFHYFNTHTPYGPPPELVEQFERPARTDPRWVPVYEYSTIGGIREEQLDPPFRRSDGAGHLSATYIDAVYDAEVRAFDIEFGRLLSRIDELGLADGAAIIFAADHGEALGEQGVYSRHCVGLHEPQVRIPLIVSWPQPAQAPPLVETLVVASDLAPTLLELAALPQASPMTGRSLVPFAQLARPEWPPRPIIMQTAFSEGVVYFLNSYRYEYLDWALIDEGYKYIFYANSVLDEVRSPLNFVNAWREILCGHIRPDELYRLAEDGDSANNLIQDQADVAARMRQRLWNSNQARFFCELGDATVASSDESQLERLRSLGYLK
ncbi:MAG: sulfatase [bacterium]|nr:sulfatase [bacterium]